MSGSEGGEGSEKSCMCNLKGVTTGEDSHNNGGVKALKILMFVSNKMNNVEVFRGQS